MKMDVDIPRLLSIQRLKMDVDIPRLLSIQRWKIIRCGERDVFIMFTQRNQQAERSDSESTLVSEVPLRFTGPQEKAGSELNVKSEKYGS